MHYEDINAIVVTLDDCTRRLEALRGFL